MSILREIAGENLLEMALSGVREVINREFGLSDCTFTMSENYKQDIVRKAETKSKALAFPWSYFLIQSLAGARDTGNNFAIRKHGVRFNKFGEKATSRKGYLFPVKLGLEFHYIDTDPKRILSMAQTLVVFSCTSGLKFQIDIGDIYSFTVSLEIPPDSTISTAEEQSAQLPEATDLVTQIVMTSTIGFFRDVSAVNGTPAVMRISLQEADGSVSETFDLKGPDYVKPW